MEDFVPFGTLLNVLTVIIGSLFGLGIRKLGLAGKLGDKDKRFSDAVFCALGLNMISVTKVKIMNYLPAMFLPVGLIPLWDLIF